MSGVRRLLRLGGPKAVGTGGAAGAAAGGREVKEGKGRKNPKAEAAAGASKAVARDIRKGDNGLKLTQVVFKGRTYEVVVKPHDPDAKKSGVKAGKEEEGTSGRRDILFRVKLVGGGKVDAKIAAQVVNEAFGVPLNLVKVEGGGFLGRAKKGVDDKDAEIARLEQLLVDSEAALVEMTQSRDGAAAEVIGKAEGIAAAGRGDAGSAASRRAQLMARAEKERIDAEKKSEQQGKVIIGLSIALVLSLFRPNSLSVEARGFALPVLCLLVLSGLAYKYSRR